MCSATARAVQRLTPRRDAFKLACVEGEERGQLEVVEAVRDLAQAQVGGSPMLHEALAPFAAVLLGSAKVASACRQRKRRYVRLRSNLNRRRPD